MFLFEYGLNERLLVESNWSCLGLERSRSCQFPLIVRTGFIRELCLVRLLSLVWWSCNFDIIWSAFLNSLNLQSVLLSIGFLRLISLLFENQLRSCSNLAIQTLGILSSLVRLKLEFTSFERFLTLFGDVWLFEAQSVGVIVLANGCISSAILLPVFFVSGIRGEILEHTFGLCE